MKHIFSTLILLLFVLFNVSSESVESLINHPDTDYPLSNTINRDNSSLQSLKLLPEDFAEAANVNRRFREYNPQITVERLYRIKLPKSSLLSSTGSGRELFTKIINILGKPETQVGYTYHSSRKNKDIVLIEDSFVTNKRGKKIDDFSFTEADLPGNFSYYQFIDDANSRGAVFEQKIVVDSDYMGYRSTNIEKLKTFIITVMKARGTRTEMLFFPVGDYLYIYNCSQILKKPALANLGISVNISSMFRKRMDVMAKWIEDQLLKELGKKGSTE